MSMSAKYAAMIKDKRFTEILVNKLLEKKVFLRVGAYLRLGA